MTLERLPRDLVVEGVEGVGRCGAVAAENEMAEDYKVADQLMKLLEHVDAGHPLRIREIRRLFKVGIATARRYREFVGRHRTLVEEREGRGGKVWRKAPDSDAPPVSLALKQAPQ